LMPYAEIESDVRQLVADFGSPRKSFHPEYPFWHLQNGGIWGLQNVDTVKKRKAGRSPSRAELYPKILLIIYLSLLMKMLI